MRYYLLLFTLLPALNLLAQDKASDIEGLWYAEQMERSTIEVKVQQDGSYSAVIIESDKPEAVGKTVFQDMRFKDGIWKGRITPPARDKSLNGTLKLNSADELKLTGRKSMMSKSFIWTRKQ